MLILINYFYEVEEKDKIQRGLRPILIGIPTPEKRFAYNVFYDNINCWMLNKKVINEMNSDVEEEDDDSWFAYDEEWDNAMKEAVEKRKVLIQNCIDIIDRILLKDGIVFVEEDDTILSFVQ